MARSLNLASVFEWRERCKEGMCPPNVPSNPDKTYKDAGWQGWGHWLGTGNQSTLAKKQQFLPFDQGLLVARSLRLVSQKEWKLWCRSGSRPANVPAAPDKAYVHGGWQRWGHWLGTGNTQLGVTKDFLPFDEALRVARCLRLNSQQEWTLWCRSGARPANVPSRPDKVYVHDGWMAWTHWLYHANLDTAAAPPEVPQPTRKRGAASGSNTGTAGSRAGKRRRR